MDRCFMAGLAYFFGLTRIGALAIRGGSSSIPALAELVRDHRPTAIVGVPTLLLRLGGESEGDGVDPAALGVERLICIGEPVRRADLVPLRVSANACTGCWAAGSFRHLCQHRDGHRLYRLPGRPRRTSSPELIVVEIVDEERRTAPSGPGGRSGGHPPAGRRNAACCAFAPATSPPCTPNRAPAVVNSLRLRPGSRAPGPDAQIPGDHALPAGDLRGAGRAGMGSRLLS